MAMYIIDRRLNPKSRSLGNRQRFVRRAKAEIREAVNEAVRTRSVTSIDGREPIKARIKRLNEPTFSLDPDQGRREFILPGNRTFQVGDRIPKPPTGAGGGGLEGSPDGEGEDEFVFTLTREEFLDVFFDDLALPDLLKRALKQDRSPIPTRAGFTTDGPPAQLSHERTMRNSLSRRIAMRRPAEAEIEALEAEAEDAEAEGDPEAAARLRERAEALRRRRRLVPYLDPLDLRYRRFERTPKPMTQAVMFCLMDTSASMTEPVKDLAKRFFMLLYLFLSREYDEVQMVFIRHTTTAREVDEETFFRGTDTGGTVVSSALEKMQEIVRARYPLNDWNIYAAQASDGQDFSDDLGVCLKLMGELLPICQYYAYVEVTSPQIPALVSVSPLWRAYGSIASEYRNFAMREIRTPDEILPVFRGLFARSRAAA